MVTYCSVGDVCEQYKGLSGILAAFEIEKRIIQAEKWVDNYQDNTYVTSIPDSIKYATAYYAAGLIAEFFFTSDEPNDSKLAQRYYKRAQEFLDKYNEAIGSDSGLSKINEEDFE